MMRTLPEMLRTLRTRCSEGRMNREHRLRCQHLCGLSRVELTGIRTWSLFLATNLSLTENSKNSSSTFHNGWWTRLADSGETPENPTQVCRAT
mmetsp:Transcript_25803/g.67640  ORF Transcript_25803/g.67640 Transcript_25803/m.67640 type:complete len:93 (+) Transcript_25803:2186-2464(+)